MGFVSISVLRKINYQLEKKWKKFRTFFKLIYLLKQIRRVKNFDVTFSLKHSLQKPRNINETMNPYLVWVMRYRSSNKIEPRKLISAEKRMRHT